MPFRSSVDTRLELALKGDMMKCLFFRGSESLPVGAAIRPVAELIGYFPIGRMAAFNPGAAGGSLTIA